MSAFILKIIALITMTCDHISYVLFKGFSFLNYIGRVAFPIFAFQITEGYIHTKNIKRYFLRLFLFALISQVPFYLFISMFTTHFELNVFFTLLLGLASIYLFDIFYKLEYKEKFIHYINILFGLICVASFAIISSVFHCDYGYYGVLIIFIFHIFKKHKIFMNLGFILATVIYYSNGLLYSLRPLMYLNIIICTCISLIFINLYNGKKGKDTKLFLYLFYPIHLLIIYALHFVL